MLARRRLLLVAAWPGVHAVAAGPSPDRLRDLAWIAQAQAQRKIALGWGDQPYGAVLVLADQVVGFGPSRVVQRNDADAHAERVALADAQQRLGRADLSGSVLYSTSHPCRVCEAAAARAGVQRMVHGESATDAGRPRP